LAAAVVRAPRSCARALTKNIKEIHLSRLEVHHELSVIILTPIGRRPIAGKIITINGKELISSRCAHISKKLCLEKLLRAGCYSIALAK
jgi:hypothetical protein